MSLPPIHLAIMQPAGFVHSLGFLDQARYFRHQLRRLGAEVSIAKNRLREDAVNLVFGAHLGFPPEWRQRHTCLFVNLEQLGLQGAAVDAQYLALLRSSAVVDYDLNNVAHYAQDPQDVPLVSFLHAPYLDKGPGLALEDRPIDLLFFGSMNPRREAYLAQIEAAGVQVASFDQPLYGEERDHYIGQAKAVLNCHYYESSRFEQARAFHCMSLGTPVISECTAHTVAPEAYEDTVFWLAQQNVAAFFRDHFGSASFFDQARAQLQAFRAHDPLAQYRDLLAFATGYHQAWRQQQTHQPWRPTRINLGSGKDYKPAWLNLDILERAQPDLVLDLGQAQTWPLQATGCLGGEIELQPGTVELVYANNVLEHVPDLPTLMGNVLDLLQEGGEFQIEVPYEKALTAWQDPTHLRALNENSWLYYTDWFWYLGWFEHRFEISSSTWLNTQLQPCQKAEAAFMKLSLRKIRTTAHERTTARTLRPDFGGIDDDLPVALAPDSPPGSDDNAAPVKLQVPTSAQWAETSHA